jgi:choline dehydrogenase-like flavoprotein
MYNAMSKMPGVEVPLDGANGVNGLFWYPSSIDPVKFWRSYSRTGHYDNITRANWDVIMGSKATKILFEGITAAGVQFVRSDNSTGPSVVKATKEVIVSAGTIHTPQLLQNSGIGPRALLERANIPVLVDLPGVGQSLQDHSFLNVSYTCKSFDSPQDTSQ